MEKDYIGRYQIQNLLGAGGMGQVYRAHDPEMERWVAIKTLPIQDERQQARFKREVKVAGNLHHPHIVTIYDVGMEDDTAYIVMELVAGGTLSDRLHSPVPWAEALSLITPICQALTYAHSKGVIHRDVKPANILLSPQKQLKLTDFGIAYLEMGQRLTQSTDTLGTPLYTAPEQIRNEKVDGRTDIFSLGIVLYELLTGIHPFMGESMPQVIYRLMEPGEADSRPLQTVAPSALIKVVKQALSKKPADRFANAQAMEIGLNACLAHASFDAPPVAFVNPAALSTPQIETVTGSLFLSANEKKLLQNAFARYDKLYLEREFKQGYSGAKVLLATPLRSGRRLTKVVLKLDTPRAIDREWQAYRAFVADTLPPMAAHITQPPVYAEDEQLALLIYTFAGELGQSSPQSLGEYYARHNGTEIAHLLETSVFETFGPKWWQQRATDLVIMRQEYDRLLPVHLEVQPATISDETALTLVAGQVNTHHFQSLQAGQTVQLKEFVVTAKTAQQGELILQASPPSGKQTNPIRIRATNLADIHLAHPVGAMIPAFYARILATRHDLLKQTAQSSFPTLNFNRPHIAIEGQLYPNPLYDYPDLLDQMITTMTSIIHGDLNLENILVTSEPELAWLIDFAATRKGHTLADFIRLETQVITKLLPQTKASPKDLAGLMTLLHQPASPAKELPATLNKALAMLTAIRRMAQTCLHNRQSWDEYYLGLVITLLGTLKFKELDDSARQLALTAAAVARSFITTPPPPLPPLPDKAKSTHFKTLLNSKLGVSLLGVALLVLVVGFWGQWRQRFSNREQAQAVGVWLTPVAIPSIPSPSATASPLPSPTSPPPDKTPSPPAQVVGQIIGPLDIFSGPGQDYPIIGKAPHGNPVQITGQNLGGKWLQIAYPSGPEGSGWVLSEFVELPEPVHLSVAHASPPPIAKPTPSNTAITLTPTAPAIATPASVMALPPTTEELESINSIWRLTPYQDLKTPGTQTYNLSVQSTDTWRWVFTWCATDKTTLTEILSPLTVNLLIDDIPLPDAAILQHEETQTNQWECHYWSTILTQWKPEETVKLQISYTLTQAINDGQESYPAGEYRQTMFVNVRPVEAVETTTSPAPALTSPEPQALIIESFETHNAASLERLFQLNNGWETNEITLTITTLPERPTRGQVLGMAYQIKSSPPNNYVGFERTLEAAQDWSEFGAVQLWLSNDSTAKEITFQWREGPTGGGEVWKATINLSGGETGVIEIPLTQQYFFQPDWSAPGDGQLKLEQVDYFAIFMAQTQAGKGIIYVDDIALIPAENNSQISGEALLMYPNPDKPEPARSLP